MTWSPTAGTNARFTCGSRAVSTMHVGQDLLGAESGEPEPSSTLNSSRDMARHKSVVTHRCGVTLLAPENQFVLHELSAENGLDRNEEVVFQLLAILRAEDQPLAQPALPVFRVSFSARIRQPMAIAARARIRER